MKNLDLIDKSSYYYDLKYGETKRFSEEFRDFLINSIVYFLRTRRNVFSIGTAWLEKLTDDELMIKYNQIVNVGEVV